MLHLVCDYCRVQAEHLYSVGHTSLQHGHLYDDSDEEAAHLHWECVKPWWDRTETERKAAEEVPF